jgi:PmbA protein
VRGASLIGNGPEALKYVSMVGNDLKLDEGIGVCGKEGQSVPVGVGIPDREDRPHDRGRHRRMNDLEQMAADAVKRALASWARRTPSAPSPKATNFPPACACAKWRASRKRARAAPEFASCRAAPGRPTRPIFRREGIEQMVRAALDLAKITTEDPHAGLPDAEDLGKFGSDLRSTTTPLRTWRPNGRSNRRGWPKRQRSDFDPRIQNSEGASFDSYLGARVRKFARFCGQLPDVELRPERGSGRETERIDGARLLAHGSRAAAGLESPELVGRQAAERALRRLNPRKGGDAKAPMIFEPRTARSLLGDLFDAVNGGAIYRHASFLVGKLGEKIASECSHGRGRRDHARSCSASLAVRRRRRGSRRTVVVERGVLKSYLLNTYSARKLGLKTTGNASRGITGNAGVGPGNFYIEAGDIAPEKIIAGIRRGLYVTELIGANHNAVTGDYSSGAAGLWIENGELAYPVSEITIAGNFKQMLVDVEHIGSDLDFRGSIAAPTLVIREMTISGQ